VSAGLTSGCIHGQPAGTELKLNMFNISPRIFQMKTIHVETCLPCSQRKCPAAPCRHRDAKVHHVEPGEWRCHADPSWMLQRLQSGDYREGLPQDSRCPRRPHIDRVNPPCSMRSPLAVWRHPRIDRESLQQEPVSDSVFRCWTIPDSCCILTVQ